MNYSDIYKELLGTCIDIPSYLGTDPKAWGEREAKCRCAECGEDMFEGEKGYRTDKGVICEGCNSDTAVYL